MKFSLPTLGQLFRAPAPPPKPADQTITDLSQVPGALPQPTVLREDRERIVRLCKEGLSEDEIVREMDLHPDLERQIRAGARYTLGILHRQRRVGVERAAEALDRDPLAIHKAEAACAAEDIPTGSRP